MDAVELDGASAVCDPVCEDGDLCVSTHWLVWIAHDVDPDRGRIDPRMFDDEQLWKPRRNALSGTDARYDAMFYDEARSWVSRDAGSATARHEEAIFKRDDIGRID